MKKQASPTPTPRAAALSQSASRFSAGTTSAWQNIAGKSPRLAASRIAAPLALPAAPGSRRVAPELQRVAEQVAPAAAPETIRQVGWREMDRAVSMTTKRKYSLFGIGFGPKVQVFETEKVKLPVYQETDREKRYYAVVNVEEVARVKQQGFETKLSNDAPQTTEQFNMRNGIYFFTNKTNANEYEKVAIGSDYEVIAFVIPEYQEFMPNQLINSVPAGLGNHLCTMQNISKAYIK